jgi:hypothetical protein
MRKPNKVVPNSFDTLASRESRWKVDRTARPSAKSVIGLEIETEAGGGGLAQGWAGLARTLCPSLFPLRGSLSSVVHDTTRPTGDRHKRREGAFFPSLKLSTLESLSSPSIGPIVNGWQGKFRGSRSGTTLSLKLSPPNREGWILRRGLSIPESN